MSRLPSTVKIGAMGSYGPRDVQDALAAGPQMSAQAASVGSQSAQPFVQNATAMMGEMYADRRSKRQYASQKSQIRASSALSLMGMGTGLAFNSLGAISDFGQMSEMSKFNEQMTNAADMASMEPASGDSVADLNDIRIGGGLLTYK